MFGVILRKEWGDGFFMSAMKLKKYFNIFWDVLVKFQRFIVIGSSLFIILLMTLVVILRYGFKADLYGIEEIVIIAAFWLYFIGASLGSYDKSHIKADILDIYIKNEKIKGALNIVTSLITVIVVVVFSYWAMGLFMWGLEMKGKSPGWGIPLIIPQSSILIGFILMSFYFVVYLSDDIRRFFTKK